MKTSTSVMLRVSALLLAAWSTACGGSKNSSVESPASSSGLGGGVVESALAEQLAKPVIACGGELEGSWKARGFANIAPGGECAWVSSFTEGQSDYTFAGGKVTATVKGAKAKGFVPACFKKTCSELKAPTGSLSCRDATDGCACDMTVPDNDFAVDYRVDGQQLIMTIAGQEAKMGFCVEGNQARWHMAGITMLLERR